MRAWLFRCSWRELCGRPPSALCARPHAASPARPEHFERTTAVNTIQLYDATLRDGMQGEGMSLSAEEKLRVAHKLDELGIELIEAGFPALEPQGARALRAARRRALRARADRRLRDDAPPRRRRPPQDAALIALAECVAPVCTLVGKTWALHLEKLVKVDREENLRMIAESIAFLRARRQARDLRRRALLRRLPRRAATTRCAASRAAAEAGAETVTLCDTNGSSLPSQVAAATRDAVGAVGDGGARRDPLPQRRRVRRSPTRSPRSRRARARCRARSTAAASAPATPTSSRSSPTCSSSSASECLTRRAARAPDRDRALRRRDPQRHARPKPALRRAQRVRAQGRHARRRRQRRRDAPSSTSTPALVGNQRELLVSELAGRASVLEKAADARDRARRRQRDARARADQGARAPRLPVRGRRRLARAAAAPREPAATSRCSRSSPGA